MKSFIRDLFDYNHAVNQQLVTLFLEHSDKASGKSVELFSHILNAHHIWNHRIDGQQPQFKVWQVHPVQGFQTIDAANFEHSLAILDRYDLDARIDYVNSKKLAFNNDIKGILFHLINHSTYHRGQIATEFRRAGIEPLATDYIVYKR